MAQILVYYRQARDPGELLDVSPAQAHALRERHQEQRARWFAAALERTS